MAKKYAYKIDGEKLKNEIARRGLNLSEVSQTIGYSKSYINYCIKDSVITKPAALLLQREFNISLDSYKLKENSQSETAAQMAPGPAAAASPTQIAQAVEAGIIAAFEWLTDEYALYKVGGVYTFHKREDMKNE